MIELTFFNDEEEGLFLGVRRRSSRRVTCGCVAKFQSECVVHAPLFC